MTNILFHLQDCRRLFLSDYEAHINIGVHDFEKRGAQRVILSIDLYVPLAATTPQGDCLDEVVDYDVMRNSISEYIKRGHVHLQETLCDDLLTIMLALPQVRAAKVASRKPDIYPDCAGVGVEVFGYNR